jgi:hypothetical protein
LGNSNCPWGEILKIDVFFWHELVHIPYSTTLLLIEWMLLSGNALFWFTMYTMFLVIVGFSLGAMLQGTEHNSGAEPDSVVL